MSISLPSPLPPSHTTNIRAPIHLSLSNICSPFITAILPHFPASLSLLLSPLLSLSLSHPPPLLSLFARNHCCRKGKISQWWHLDKKPPEWWGNLHPYSTNRNQLIGTFEIFCFILVTFSTKTGGSKLLPFLYKFHPHSHQVPSNISIPIRIKCRLILSNIS